MVAFVKLQVGQNSRLVAFVKLQVGQNGCLVAFVKLQVGQNTDYPCAVVGVSPTTLIRPLLVYLHIELSAYREQAIKTTHPKILLIQKSQKS